MFTGIITDIGTLVAKTPFGDGARLLIDCQYDAAGIEIGASIACAGVCLTVTALEDGGNRTRFAADVSGETMEKTTVGSWEIGDAINLERPLKAGDELGGHIVSGHVDGVAEIVARDDHEEMTVFRFAPPKELVSLIAEKGSVALDGTSLTVIEADDTFTVMTIPHTMGATTWGNRKVGDVVNIEVDTIARYVARLVAVRGADA
ncbi:riboflavin synthase [Acuticoccus sp. M5D2P5]|uniref:riboflavin synthase n=1 Tax=Acuticoccus kalidii TaxID=2910977 RepID=UPI001F44B501|nr:riboflavin synthase [Acuticoccus kalidii]MCF3936352.1 riboflavin synthase [Acuticoccus kalidii]